MIRKYTRALEERQINTRTEEIWKIDDVPTMWRIKVQAQIYIDGYMVSDDGTVILRS